jgi:5-methyltetrahydropteroyltriglutamate--homocysteine methyltransferase
MLGATKELVLPTTITGSLPRPRWYTEGLNGRAFRAAMANIDFQEQYVDALSCLLRDQERAGLDILTDGDHRFDHDVGGRSWMLYTAQRLGGVSGVDLVGRYATEARLGTIMREFFECLTPPVVTGKITRGPLEFTALWKVAQRLTDRPVKFGTATPEVVEGGLLNRHYTDRAELIHDIADVINAELTELAGAGCPIVQVEEPWVHRAHYRQRPDVFPKDFYADLFNRTVRGLGERTEVWCHTCWGNPAAQRQFATPMSYAPILEDMNRLHCDVITFETVDNDGANLEQIGKIITGKKVAIGVVSHRTLQVETPEDVAAMIRLALKHIRPERLVISTDCGFGREGMSRRHALYKMASITLGTNLVRRELGLPERPCRLADPRFTLVPSA